MSATDTGAVCHGSACTSGCLVGGIDYTTKAPNPNNACQTCQPDESTSGWSPVADGSGCVNGQVCAGGACGTSCDVGGWSTRRARPDPANACESCEPGVSATAWTSDAIGTSCGPSEVCDGTTCAAGCFIDGTAYPSGAANPANGCERCVPGSSTTAWTTSADGSTCGAGRICSASSCTAGCFVGGSFYAPGAANPVNACETCQPIASSTAWTAAAIGASCGGGQVCSATSCGSGCYISGTLYAAGAPNPANACQTCQPGQSTAAWGSAGDGLACGNGQVCAGGSCGTQCDIGGTVYPSGTVNPSNACQSCQPGMSTAAWSGVPNGTSCALGEVCNTASCIAACYIGGAFYGAAAANPANACQTCQPTVNATGWTSGANGTACGAGEVCSASGCAAGCFIGGTVYAAAAPDPASPCQACQPATSTTTWTSLANGASCGTGEVCSGSSCVAGCFIAGAVVASGAPNPASACQSCQPGSSTSAWTNVASGASCGTGEVCGGAGCVPGCYIGGTVYASGAASPANACQTCQPGSSTLGWSGVPDGSGCGNGHVCAAGTCGAQCDIGGKFYASGAANPANACQLCQPGSTTSAWSNDANGTSCAAGEVCNAASCVSGCYVGGVFYGPGAPNPVNVCQSCLPSTSTTAFSNVPDGAFCGTTTASCFSGACKAPPSCAASSGAGTTACGASSDSCCTSLEVPGGTFERTYPGADGGAATDPAQLTGFRLDKYDVTVGRFRNFVTAWNNGAGWTPTAGSGKHVHLNGGKGLMNSAAPGAYEPGWSTGDTANVAPTTANLASCDTISTWTSTAGTQESLPVNCVNWDEAYAFCIWDGGFLPSEAEWEYAAAGGNQQRLYPWGSTDPGAGNQYAIYGAPWSCYYPTGTLGSCQGVLSIAPVGTPTLGAGLYGQLDLGGGGWQWALDWATPYVSPCNDCANTSPNYYRSMRGGFFSSPPSDLEVASRQSDSPTSRADYYLGGPHAFRCARTP